MSKPSPKFAYNRATNLLGNVVSNVDFLVVQQHTVDGLNSRLGCLSGLIVYKSVAFGATMLVRGDLAGQNVTECGKRIVQSLVIDCFVQVLDENVALASLAEGGVTLGPHDAAIDHPPRLAFILQALMCSCMLLTTHGP